MDNTASNYRDSIDYIKNTNIDYFDPVKITLLKNNFITENSKDIPYDLIAYSAKNINRPDYVIRLSNLLNNIKLAHKIEASVYEFSLLHATLCSLDKKLIEAIYEDKFIDIFMNLDLTSRLANKTLSTSVMNGVINPRLVAFLSPDQTHPESFAVILKKIKFRQEAENNMATTDMYKCTKCGERKHKINEIQLRSADEQTSKVITCMVCYHTFIK